MWYYVYRGSMVYWIVGVLNHEYLRQGMVLFSMVCTDGTWNYTQVLYAGKWLCGRHRWVEG